jgi:hypothetical protein
MRRCPTGSRRNKRTGNCEPYPPVNAPVAPAPPAPALIRRKCPNGTRRNKRTGNCDPYPPVAPVPVPLVNAPVPVPLVNAPLSASQNTPNRNARVVQRFMNKTKHKRIARFLSSVCSDSGVCIAFGKEINKIKEFFGNFNLSYVKDPIQRIEASSANGFINEIKFTHQEYSSYAVLKSSTSAHSDNLMYEYRVGQFLNKMALRYPCFVETYNLYKYKTENSWKFVKKNKIINADVFKTHLELQTYDIKEACKSSKHLAVLIQHLKGVISMTDLVDREHESLNYNFLTLLYQVYFVLDNMKHVFTHYDLHGNNVLLYEPSNTKYIQYHYHSAAGVTTFKSIYVAKIIDYGRSHFTDTVSSSMVRDSVCAEKTCNNKTRGRCGEKVGFGYLIPPIIHNINPSNPNISHDLRLYYYLIRVLLSKPHAELLPNITKIIHDDIGRKLLFESRYGTREKLVCSPNEICNVNVLHAKLKVGLASLNLDAMFNQYYPGRTKLGDMHIYEDRPLEFIE